MGLAMRGVTHCSECGTTLRMGELATCDRCRKELKEQNKEKKNMGNITISMEEYKELLIIKGKYEELKGQPRNSTTYSPILKRELEIPQTPYKVTCKGGNNE